MVLYCIDSWSSLPSSLLLHKSQYQVLPFCFFKYLIYDIVNCKYFLISLFVDDTRFFVMVDDPVSLAKRHNSDIVEILQ